MNTDRILEPLDGDPTGVDLRVLDEGSDKGGVGFTYSGLRQKRNRHRREEQQLLRPRDATPDWGPLRDDLVKQLESKTKDVELAAWLTEALVRLDGFEGLRDGLVIINGLITNYWDGLFPRPDDDGVLDTLRAVTHLDTVLRIPIDRTPITSDDPISYSMYKEKTKLDSVSGDELDSLISDGWRTSDEIDAAVASTSSETFRELGETLDAILAEVSRLDEHLSEKGGCAPLAGLAEKVDDVKAEIEHILAERTPEEASSVDTEPAGGAHSAAPTAAKALDRDHALAELSRIAVWFRKTEPHSPISYALEQVVRWGKASLPDLLSDVLPAGSDRSQMFRLVGIEESKEEN